MGLCWFLFLFFFETKFFQKTIENNKSTIKPSIIAQFLMSVVPQMIWLVAYEIARFAAEKWQTNIYFNTNVFETIVNDAYYSQKIKQDQVILNEKRREKK